MVVKRKEPKGAFYAKMRMRKGWKGLVFGCGCGVIMFYEKIFLFL